VRLGLAPFAWFAGRGAERRLETRAAKQTPTAELMRLVRKRALHRTGAPVVAGPWLGNEVEELLYWIPFLRRLQGMDAGLKERLFVIRRAAGAAWYDGIGAGQVDLEQLIPDVPPEEVTEEDLQGPLRDEIAGTFGFGSRAFRVLPAGLVAATREALAAHKPSERKRLLEFAPLRLRANEYVGPYGPEAIVAVLSGVDAAAFSSELEPPDPHDLKVVSSYLAEPPYGRLTIDEGTPEERAAQLLETQAALAAV
jgi:hypothetical protein